jgi:hypothetical protein
MRLLSVDSFFFEPVIVTDTELLVLDFLQRNNGFQGLSASCLAPRTELLEILHPVPLWVPAAIGDILFPISGIS